MRIESRAEALVNDKSENLLISAHKILKEDGEH